MKTLLVMIVLAAVAGSASAAYVELVPTTTYTNTLSGSVLEIVYDGNTNRGVVIGGNTDDWSGGLPTNGNPGLVVGGTHDFLNPEISGMYGIWVRQTGGQLTDAYLPMRGGAKGTTDGNIIEIDDASNDGSYTNLAIEAQLTMWNSNGGDGNELSVLNGYATVGYFNTTPNPAVNARFNILNGRLDVGYLEEGKASCTVTMLAGGTGAVDLADMTSTATMDQMVLNFETGSEASFTIASNGVANAQGYWETKIAAGKVQIDGVAKTSTNLFVVVDAGALGTKISLAPPDIDPPTPNAATFASQPIAISRSVIYMTATEGSDASGPVEYYFDETSGNPAGTDSGWQPWPSYPDVGLDPDTPYSYTVTLRDASGNTGTVSSAVVATTLAAGPGSGSPGLSVTNGTLYKEGVPYKAAGVNYCDMFQAMLQFPEYAGQTEYRTLEGLEFLGEQNIPFARFWSCGFWPSNWDLYFSDKTEWFRRMDLAVATAEAANVGLIPSLFWRWQTYPELMGEYRDAWADPASKTRQFMTNYVHEVVGRYKDSPAIWGWEFCNEMNLNCDLPNWTNGLKVISNLGVVGPATEVDERNRMTYAIAETAFNAFAAEVRKLDTHRFITTGNSNPREASWHNRMETNWVADTYAEAKEAFGWMQPASMDMASVHVYPKGAELEYAGASGTTNVLQIYSEFCDDQNQAMFVGEYRGFVQEDPDLDSQRADYVALVNGLVASGADLMAYWVFDYSYNNTSAGNIRATNDYTWVLDKVRETDAKMRGEEPLSLAGVPVDWFDQNGIAPTGALTLAQVETQDLNGNGLMVWEDYMVGFQPLETGAVFSITGFEQFPGATPRLSWQGGTNGLMTPYMIQSTTTLMDSTSWKIIGTNAREQGENIWTGTTTADPTSYFRVIVSP